MENLRIIPPDPMEVERLPIDEVDPAIEANVEPGDPASTDLEGQREPQYVENEGLDAAPAQPHEDVERSGVS